MFWQEEDDETPSPMPQDVVDVLFSVDCKRLPVDHAHALSAALQDVVPWTADTDAGVAVHAVHVAGSQNGWERPRHGTDQFLMLSKRTKLAIRVPAERSEALMRELAGKRLDVAGCPLAVGPGKIRPLTAETTLLARYVVATGVVAAGADSEEAFLAWAVEELRRDDIRVRKALCGKSTPLTTPNGPLHTRSLLVANLAPRESVRLQHRGLGAHREMGCGIFIPHKGVDAVGKGT